MKARRTPTAKSGNIPLWRQLRWSLIFYFIVLAVLPVIAVGFIVLRQSTAEAQEQVFDQLSSVATLKQAELNRWLGDGQVELRSVVADSVRINFVNQLLTDEAPTPEDGAIASGVLADQELVSDQFTEFLIYTPQGQVVAASAASQVGKIVTLQPYFSNSLTTDDYIQTPYYEIGSGELTMYMTLRLTDTQGNLIGVLAGRLDINTLDQIMTVRAGLGESGETYLVSLENNYLLTPSRFEGYEVRTRAYRSEGIDRALQQQNGSGIFDDYRGVRVLSVYRWIPQLQAGLLSEQDEAEALESARQQRNTTITIGIVGALGAAAAGFYLATRVSRPITYLTGVANRLAAGELTTRANMTEKNEVGVLGQTFDQMTSQLQDIIDSLEFRVADRTKDITTTLEVGRLATAFYGREDFLPRIVNFIRDNFDLYYVQVYLLDEGRRFAILRAGTGEVGEQLLARNHRLDLNETSLVAQAVESGQPVLVADTHSNPNFKPNPLLPLTRSETAIPLIIVDEILGVLDMQSDKAGSFTPENLPVFGTMATQIAGILRATRAFDETRAAVERADAINRRLTRENWEGYLGRVARGERVGFQYDLESPTPLEVSISEIVDEEGNHSYAVQPITLRGQTIGNIAVREDYEREWQPEELALIREAANLVAQATEQYRTVDETEKRANELAVVAKVSATAASIQDQDLLLQTVADLTQEQFNLYHAHVYLLSEDQQFLLLAAGAGEPGRMMKASGHRIPLKQEYSLVARAARTRQGVISNNVSTERDFLPNPLLPNTKSEMALPMIVGEGVIGVLDVQDNVANRFTEDDVQILTTLADQLGVAINNVRQFEAAQRRLKDAQAVNRINEFLRTGLDDETAFENILGVMLETFSADNAVMSAFNHDTQFWQGVVGAGMGMTSGMAKNFSDPALTYPHGFEAVQTGRVVAVHNARTYPNFPMDFIENIGIKSVLVIPIIRGKTATGVMFLNYNEALHFFNQEEITLAENIRSQLTLGLERRAAEAQNELFYNTGRNLIEAANLQELLEAFVGPILDNIPGAATLLFTDENDSTLLELVASVATSERSQLLPVGTRINLADLNVPNPTDTEAQVQLVSDIRDPRYGYPEAYIQALQTFGTRALASIPLIASGRNIGSISLTWPEPRRFDEQESQYYEVFRSQLTTIVEVRRLVVEVERNAALLRTVLDTTPDWIFAKDKDYRFILVNESFARGIGSTRDEIIGKDDLEVGIPKELVFGNPDEGIRGFRTDDNVVLKEGQVIHNSHDPVTFADGSIHIMDTQKLPLMDEKGQPIGVLGFSRDVTQRIRTQQREQLATELGQQLSALLHTEDLLHQTVTSLSESLGYYHVHIYLYEPDTKALVVGEGLGEAGAFMKGQSHRIPLVAERSLVARSARALEPIIVNDIQDDPNFLPNPMLPLTQSEVAIPLYQGQTLIGVLDIQHDQPDYFNPEEVATLLIVANQLSVSISNVRQFERAEKRGNELEVVSDLSAIATTILDQQELLQTVADLTKESFDLYHAHVYLTDKTREYLVLTAGAGEVGRMMIEEQRKIPFQHPNSLVALAARNAEGVISNDVTESEDFLPNPLLPDTRSEMAVPMMVAGEVIGVLDVQSNVINRFSVEDLNIQTALASQLAVAVTNARAFEERRLAEASLAKRAAEIETVAQVGIAASTILDTNQLLLTVSNVAKERFNLYHAHIYLVDEARQNLILTAGAGEAGKRMMAEGRRISLKQSTSLVARAAREAEAVIANDVIQSPDYLPNPLLPDTRSEMAIPLIVGGEVIGVLDVQSDEVDHFTDDDIRVQSTLASQLAVAVANARAFENVETARQEVSRIFNLSADMIGSAGFDGYFKNLNPAWERTLGWANDELLSKPFIEYVHPEDRQRTLDEYSSQMERGAPSISFENRYRCKDGSYKWVSWNAIPYPDEEITYFVVRDVTLQKDTERRERLANELGQQLSSLLKAEDLLKETVEQLTQAFGYYHTQIYLLDEDQQRLVLKEGVGRAGEIMKQQNHSIPLRAERSLVAQAGRNVQAIVADDVAQDPSYLPNPLLPYTRAEAAIPVFAGERLLGVLDVQHNTPSFFNEAQVRTLLVVASQLAVALSNAELYEEQLRATEQLRELDRLKNEFLASMSHELRTPLNSIIGYAEVILDGLDGPLNEEMEEDVNSIHQSGKLLLSLINDILDLAKIEAGQMELEYEPVDIFAFLEKAVESSNILVKDKPVEMRVEVTEAIRDLDQFEADPIRLQQIVNNLLSNAAKFTDEGTITAKARVENGSVVIAIVDSGFGIAADKLEIIFERFRQADQSSTRKAGGTGLGLAITRQLVTMHGGDIWVESEMGKGTTFSFSIPLERPQEPVSGD